jgi:FkbM family methyltransferase
MYDLVMKNYHKLLVALKLMSRDRLEWEHRFSKTNFRKFIPQAKNKSLRLSYESYFISNRRNLHEKYFRLIDGLDDESIHVIATIVSRLMKHYQNGIHGWHKIRFKPTINEERMDRKIYNDFHSKVVRFENDIYAYKNWLLPTIPLVESFFDKHFIEEFNGINNFKNKDIIDAGAYIGDSALVFQDYTDKKVYAFEPHPKNQEKIVETIKLNNSTKIIPVALGLGDKTGRAFMKGSGSLLGASFINTGVPVKITTLDEWVKNNNVEVGLIKADVEGFEQKLLLGALETIRKYKPAMLISIYHSASDLFEIKPFIDSLNLGYKFKIRRTCHDSLTTETMLLCEVAEPS